MSVILYILELNSGNIGYQLLKVLYSSIPDMQRFAGIFQQIPSKVQFPIYSKNASIVVSCFTHAG